MTETIQNDRKTGLYDRHMASGARMVSFSGWSMPVQYEGIIAEHLHTRARAGLFDICHMGEFFLRGPAAEKDLEKLVTCRVGDMPEGRCRYGFLLNDTGGIIDDLIVFRTGQEEFMMVVNAGNTTGDAAWIAGRVSGGTTFTDESDTIAKIDVQGPLASQVMKAATDDDTAAGLGRFRFITMRIMGVEVLVSRTGYTGENGYELFFGAEHACGIWDLLMEQEGVKPVGLGARDTLRMEMGYSLYGNDIDEAHTPLEAILDRFVVMEKDFNGKEALLKQRAEGFGQVLTGFVCEGRRSARGHFAVLAGGERVGEVTSGAFSPCLKKGIGLCYINRAFSSEGQKIVLTDGKAEIKGRVTALPIYRH